MLEHAAPAPAYRSGLEEPTVPFARCAITGEWAKVVAFRLEDAYFDVPDTDDGVIINDDGKPEFTKMKRYTIESKVTISADGLALLLNTLDSAPHPMKAVAPQLVYEWRVNYNDGTFLSQFMNGEEYHGGDIEWDKATSMWLTHRHNKALPSYAFNIETGELTKNGEILEIEEGAPFAPGETEIVLCRQNTLVLESSVKDDSLDRDIECHHAITLYLLGWRQGNDGPGYIIAIDDRGEWRPFYAKK